MEKGSTGIPLQDPNVRANESIIHEGIKALCNGTPNQTPQSLDRNRCLSLVKCLYRMDKYIDVYLGQV